MNIGSLSNNTSQYRMINQAQVVNVSSSPVTPIANNTQNNIVNVPVTCDINGRYCSEHDKTEQWGPHLPQRADWGQLDKQTQQELLGTTQLLEGYLSIELFKQKLLKKTVFNIEEQLKKLCPDHPPQSSFLLQHRRDDTFVRLNKCIHIALLVSITS